MAGGEDSYLEGGPLDGTGGGGTRVLAGAPETWQGVKIVTLQEAPLMGQGEEAHGSWQEPSRHTRELGHPLSDSQDS